MLAWYFASAMSAAATKSVAFDEILHLAGGYSYWKFCDFRFQPENGILPQRWATIPLLFGDTKFPDLSPDEWQHADMSAASDGLLYGPTNDADSILRRSRAMIGLLGVALGLLIFLSARSLLGNAPALVSLGLYSFCPTMLAHGGLATSDMAATLFFTAAVLCFWQVLHIVNWKTLIVGSVVIGCLFVSKFSAVLIVPMAFVLLAVRLTSQEPTIISFRRNTWHVDRRSRRLLVHLATTVVQSLLVIIVIWSFYNFRYGMFTVRPDGEVANAVTPTDLPAIAWNDILDQSKPIDRLIMGMRGVRLLPEAFLFGFAYVVENSHSRPAFLNGEYRLYGWPQFFPYCVLVKTPITLFVLLGLAIAWMTGNWYFGGETWRARGAAMARSLYRTTPLWTLFVVYWIFAITSHLNIGHRHVLPTYPPMLILAGCSWYWVTDKRLTSAACIESIVDQRRINGRVANWLNARRQPILAVAVLASIASFTTESLSNWPNYLSYFNQFVGSHTNAYRHLVDSSLDWGQDLPSLQQWLIRADLAESRPYISYFGNGSLEYYGIRAHHLPGYWEHTPPSIPEPLKGGTYCISATMLQNLYTRYPGRWNRAYEARYQQLTANVHQFFSNSVKKRRQLMEDEAEAWTDLFDAYEHARFARLASYLRQREPDDEINYSILIYHLTAADLQRALGEPPVELFESDGFDDSSTAKSKP